MTEIHTPPQEKASHAQGRLRGSLSTVVRRMHAKFSPYAGGERQHTTEPQQISAEPEVAKEPFFAKDSWLDAHIEGNNLWPQINYPIRILDAAALINDPPSNWLQLLDLKVRPEQVDKLKEAMIKGHRTRGIRYMPSDIVKQGDSPVQDERLEGLFRSGLNIGAEMIIRLTQKNPAIFGCSPDALSELNTVFSPDSTDPRKKSVEQILLAARDILKSDFGDIVAGVHRGYLVRRSHGHEPWRNKQTPAFAPTGPVARYLHDNTEGRDVENDLRYLPSVPAPEFESIFANMLHKKLPDLDQDFIFNAMISERRV